MTPPPPDWINSLRRPTLILREDRARRNIRRMSQRLSEAGVQLRPHFKTHQSAQVSQWFRDEGVTRITVSSVDMARYFADAGWQDITLAFPVNLRQLEEVDRLASEVTLGLVVDNETAIAALADALHHRARLWFKIDAGYGRAGLSWSAPEPIIKLARTADRVELLEITGMLAHAGHSYKAGSVDEILAIHRQTIARMTDLRWALEAKGFNLALSIGDTPCCSLADQFDTIDEVRPGNYVFYDLTQAHLGTCADDDIAVATACPVVGVYPDQRKIVLYGGAVHLSKDWLSDDRHGDVYGYLARPTESGWSPPDRRCAIVSLSQEHAVVTVAPGAPFDWSPGEMAMVLPVHSCLTADLHDAYITPGGETLPRRRS